MDKIQKLNNAIKQMCLSSEAASAALSCLTYQMIKYNTTLDSKTEIPWHLLGRVNIK